MTQVPALPRPILAQDSRIEWKVKIIISNAMIKCLRMNGGMAAHAELRATHHSHYHILCWPPWFNYLSNSPHFSFYSFHFLSFLFYEKRMMYAVLMAMHWRPLTNGYYKMHLRGWRSRAHTQTYHRRFVLMISLNFNQHKKLTQDGDLNLFYVFIYAVQSVQRCSPFAVFTWEEFSVNRPFLLRPHK